MLSRPSFLAVVPVLLLATALLAGEPIFDSRPGHPWDQARDIFYVRRFATGEVFEHPHAFGPPWNEFIPFTRDAVFYEQVLSRLEAVEKLPPAQMEEQPASRRLIFLRDLWPVFDGLHFAHHSWPRDEDEEASGKAVARRDELLRRVARIMQRLELTEEEVRALPSAFQTIGEKQLYPKAFDPSSVRYVDESDPLAGSVSEPVFPTDLLDKDGPWVTYSSEQQPSAGGMAHMDSARHRSVFTLHLRTPDGRDGGVNFLKDFTKTEGQQFVPPGTTLALLRRALVPTRSEKLLVSPFVESLQLIVVTQLEDQRFKFTLDRKEFLTGGAGMKLLGPDDPVDTSSFEAIVIQSRIMSTLPREPAPPSESLIAGQYRTLREIPSSLGICAECHTTITRTNIFGGLGRDNAATAAYLQSNPDEAAATIVKKKEASEEWKSYLRLRTAQDESQEAAIAALQKLGGDVSSERVTFRNSEITDADLIHLKDMTSVTMLAFNNCRNVTDAGLVHLKRLKNVETLYLPHTGVGDAGLEHLQGMTNLTNLYLPGSNVGDAGLEHLKGMTSLRVLYLDSTKVTDAGLERLEGLTKLVTLSLNDTEVTNDGLKHLTGMNNLYELRLNGTEINDAGLKHLQGLSELRFLFLSGSRVTDAGLEHLKWLTNLQELYLNETEVSDAGLEHLEALTKLGRLELTKTNVTDTGVDKLQRALPTCKISHLPRQP